MRVYIYFVLAVLVTNPVAAWSNFRSRARSGRSFVAQQRSDTIKQSTRKGTEKIDYAKQVSGLFVAAMMWNMPGVALLPVPVHAATSSSSQQLKKELQAMNQDTSTPEKSEASTKEAKKTSVVKAAKKNAVLEVPAISSAEAQAAADAAVKAAVKAADPIKKSAPLAATQKKVVEVMAPKKSVEEVALTSILEKQQVNKDRLQVVMKNELPKARDELKKAKGEGKNLESRMKKLEDQKKAAKKKNAERDTFRIIDTELGDVKRRLGFVNQEVSGFSKAVERGEGESTRLKKEIGRQGDLVKELRERYKVKTAELKAKEKKQAEEDKIREFKRNKQDAERRLSFEKGKLSEATKETNAAAASQKRLKIKNDDLEVDLKLARKEEAKRIKLVNDLRGVLQKEINALEKQQKTIMDINTNLGETTATLTGAEKDVSIKTEALKAEQSKVKAAESALKKFD